MDSDMVEQEMTIRNRAASLQCKVNTNVWNKMTFFRILYSKCTTS